MRKRVFWIAVGVVAGIVIAGKAEAYVRAHTPSPVSTFFGSGQGGAAARTAGTLVNEFNAYRREREEELNRQYAQRHPQAA